MASSTVVKVPAAPRMKMAQAPKVRIPRPKMPADAVRLSVPQAKRVKNGKEFVVGRKPII